MIHEVIESLVTEFFKGVKYEYLMPCPDCVRNVSETNNDPENLYWIL